MRLRNVRMNPSEAHYSVISVHENEMHEQLSTGSRRDRLVSRHSATSTSKTPLISVAIANRNLGRQLPSCVLP